MKAANDGQYSATGRRAGKKIERRQAFRDDLWKRHVLPLERLDRLDYTDGAGPARCGVYLLFYAGAVVYVGRSLVVRDRLAEHRRDGTTFDSFAFVQCPSAFADEIEIHYIRATKPTDNVMYNRAGR